MYKCNMLQMFNYHQLNITNEPLNVINKRPARPQNVRLVLGLSSS